jgi:hypothetical protein
MFGMRHPASTKQEFLTNVQSKKKDSDLWNLQRLSLTTYYYVKKDKILRIYL